MAGKFFNAYYVYEFGKAKSPSIKTLPGKHQFGDLAHAKKAIEKHVGKKLTWKKDKQVSYNLWNGYNRAGKWRGDIQEQRKNPNLKQKSKIIKKYGTTSGTRFAAVEFDNGNRVDVRIRGSKDGKLENHFGDVYPTEETRAGPIKEKALELIRSKNPMARKKKRSAKQLANDRRLGRMAKARAKKKRGGRRKKTVRKKARRRVVRKRNVHATRRRTKLAKSHLWRVFRCRGKSVFWILMDSNGKWNWTKKTGKAILFATKEAAGTVARGIAKKRGYAPYQLGAAPREMSAAQIAAGCKQGK